MDYPLWKNPDSPTFLTFWFLIKSKNTFFFLEYHQTHFAGCFLFFCFFFLPKGDGKMSNFWPKPWTKNPLWKNSSFSFFFFFNFYFYSLKTLLSILEYHQTHFPGLFFFSNKRWKKIQIFCQSHGVTPLKKLSNFWLF